MQLGISDLFSFEGTQIQTLWVASLRVFSYVILSALWGALYKLIYLMMLLTLIPVFREEQLPCKLAPFVVRLSVDSISNSTRHTCVF